MSRVIRSRKVKVGGALVALALAFGLSASWLEQHAVAEAQAGAQAPRFEVDPMWPKPMPNNWVLGQTIGLTVDDRDHIWLIHRGNDPGTAGLDRTELAVVQPGSPRVSECCDPAPPVLEFDQAGNLVNSWGGPVKGAPYEWPESNHGIVIDHKGFVWIGGNGGNDSHILKFTRDGKFVAQYGKAGARRDPKSTPEKPNYVANSMDMDNFGRVAKIFIDPKANEGYVADGYLNHRVAVMDLDNGKIKRFWGAYGKPPTDERRPAYDPKAPPSTQFALVHGIRIANDGLVYVSDRLNDRVQVFKKDGTYIQEFIYDKETLGSGSVGNVTLWPDRAQSIMAINDPGNFQIRFARRSDGAVLGVMGHYGTFAGQLHLNHQVEFDSEGNLYTSEDSRVQKFVPSFRPAK